MWQWIRERAGFFAVSSALLISFLGALINLLPPPQRLIPILLLIFIALFLIGIITVFIQQQFAGAQARQQNSTLQNIECAVGATQAEAADTAADTNRKIVELQIQLSEHDRPVVIIRMSVDGEAQPAARPVVQNIGKTAATNVKIEDIVVRGARGPGTFAEVHALPPGEEREVDFYAPDEGLLFGQYFITYLEHDLRMRPPVDWQAVAAGERDLFEPLRMAMCVTYTDPITNRRYRSEHELEMTFSRHVTVIFRSQIEVA